MSKGTILYVGGFELPDKNAAAHRVLSNGKIFRELGYEVVFIDVEKSLPFDSDILGTQKKVQGFDCWSVPYPKAKIEWLKYLSSIDFIRVMTKKYSGIKVVVAYNYPALALENLKKYCSNKNIKVIGDCTEWYSTKGTNFVFKVIKGLDSFFRMRIIQKRLDGLIVISKYLEEYYKDCNNVVRIPPLVDINEEKWKSDIVESHEIAKKSYKLRLIYSGNPGRNKDKINYLIEMLSNITQYENYILRIIGISKKEYIQDYPEHIELLELLGERIIFLGKVSHKQSLDYLKESDFSIFIRDNTKLTKAGFPTKFVESISCGVPVITTLSSDLSSYLIEDENGFKITNPKDFSHQLEKIMEVEIKEIEQMRDYCIKNNPFHYHYYVKSIEKMLNKINKLL